MCKTTCELCGALLTDENRIDKREEVRYGSICGSCLENLHKDDEHHEYGRSIVRSHRLNNFSYWYPKIESCGIKTPRSLIFKVPSNIQEILMSDYEDGQFEIVDEWVKKEILPVIKKKGMHLLFVKNGTFSAKFDATSCFVTPTRVTESIISINYDALILGAGGFGEVIIRERILHNQKVIPCIYNGLPLRNEFRVFYDFTKKEVIFTENYWRYDYVFPKLMDATDKIIFEHEKERVEEVFASKKQEVEELVARAMESVTTLEGPWSVDIMYESGEYYLIDMALAEMSAYWEERPGNKAAFERAKEVAKKREAARAPIKFDIMDPAEVERLEKLTLEG